MGPLPPRPMGPCRKVPRKERGHGKCLFEFSPGLLLEIRAGNLSILRDQETFDNFSGKRAPFHRKFHHPSAASLFSFLFFFFYFSSPAGNLFEETRKDDRSILFLAKFILFFLVQRSYETFYLPPRREMPNRLPLCRRFVPTRCRASCYELAILMVNVPLFFFSLLSRESFC